MAVDALYVLRDYGSAQIVLAAHYNDGTFKTANPPDCFIKCPIDIIVCKSGTLNGPP